MFIILILIEKKKQTKQYLSRLNKEMKSEVMSDAFTWERIPGYTKQRSATGGTFEPLNIFWDEQ